MTTSLAAMEAFLLGEEPSLTRVQVAERAGVPLELAVQLWHQLGFPHRSDDDVAFAESDVEALRLTSDLVRLGILPPESQAALVRTWGRSYARLAEWQTTLLAGVAVAGRRPGDRADRSSRPTCCRGSRPCRPTSGAATSPAPRSTCSRTPARLSSARVPARRSASSTSSATPPRAAASTAPSWSRGSTASSRTPPPLVVDHGGQVIKTIGDEVLFTVADPAAAVEIALTLTARGDDADDPFPAVRAGIAHGAVVRRLGDVFGSTVNAASRLTSAARPGTVLVDAGVHEALTAVDGRRGRRRRRARLALASAAPGLGQGLRPPRGVAGAGRRSRSRTVSIRSPRRGTGPPGPLANHEWRADQARVLKTRALGPPRAAGGRPSRTQDMKKPGRCRRGKRQRPGKDESTPLASGGTTVGPVVFVSSSPVATEWDGYYRIVT